jgi:hypothetical protein
LRDNRAMGGVAEAAMHATRCPATFEDVHSMPSNPTRRVWGGAARWSLACAVSMSSADALGLVARKSASATQSVAASWERAMTGACVWSFCLGGLAPNSC